LWLIAIENWEKWLFFYCRSALANGIKMKFHEGFSQTANCWAKAPVILSSHGPLAKAERQLKANK